MPRRPKIRFSAIFVGLLLVGGICAITPYNNYFIENSRIAGNHLPVGSIFGLLLLVFVVNLPLRLLTRNSRFSLSSLELAVIWMMLIVAVGIPSMGLLQFLLPCPCGTALFHHPRKRLGRDTPTAHPRMVSGHRHTSRNRFL